MDPKTGKVTTKLVLEDKPRPPSKLSHSLRDAPAMQWQARFTKRFRSPRMTTWAWRVPTSPRKPWRLVCIWSRRATAAHKLKPYRKAAQAERQLEKANINVLYQKSLQDNPQAASNPLSRWQQKQQIKKQYALPNGPHSPAGPPPVPPRNPARQPKRSKKRPSRPVPM